MKTRRDVLRLGGTAVITGLTVGAAGCSGIGDGGGGGGSADALDPIPGRATAVLYADVGGMIEDSAVEELVNTSLDLMEQRRYYEGPGSFQELLEQTESQTGLDPTAAGEAISFGAYPPSLTGSETGGETAAPGGTPPVEPPTRQYAGVWFTGEWDVDDLVTAVRENQGVRLAETEYANRTLYRPTSEFGSWLGVVDEEAGEFVTGTEDAVKDTLDVAAGEVDPVGETLRSAYAGVRSGLLKVAGTVPDDIRGGPFSPVGVDREIDPSQFGNVQTAAGTAYHDGNAVGAEVKLTSDSEDDAEDVKNIIAGVLSAMEESAETTSGAEDLGEALDSISVTQDGTTVTISYENTVDALSTLIEAVAEDFLGMGEGGGTPVGTPTETEVA